MTEQHESTPEFRLTPNRPPGSRRAFWITLIVMLMVWGATMAFRWQLRAQWWAYQITHSESQEDRDFYLTRLASIRDKSLRATDDLLADPRPEMRTAGIIVLQYCESKTAAQKLMGLLTDRDKSVVIDAATALAKRRDAASYVPALSARLRERAGLDAWGTTVALGRIGGAEAERALIDALTRPLDPNLKAQTIDSLGMLGCEQAVPLMIDSIGDERPVQVLPQSQQSARRAVAALAGDLRARGADPESAMHAASTAPTVSAVAARWVQLLSGMDREESDSSQSAGSRPAKFPR